MLAGKRAHRVGEQIQREIANILMDKVRDPRVKGVTITGVRLSNDLKSGRIFYSVIGDKTEIDRAQAGLDSARRFVKREIGRRMALKYVPEIMFIHDSSLERGSAMEALFQRLNRDKGNHVTE
ncbi:MAG: 30S ribosome-binding factor RbfA [Desulfatiglans sp.]|jgi:ribosome-binding factor A|nr:30S ribosome-binding factor RbfA [Thermodesulfobacteriota bacterium]MEE4351325.1 30S ribosome-binding factor RbfA [Desulfatiglans sp.]